MKPYLKDINILKNLIKKSDVLKIQLTTAIKFISSKETDEECAMHSKSDAIEITIYHKANKVIK